MGETTMRDRLRNYPKLKKEVEDYKNWRLQYISSTQYPTSRPSDGSKHQPGPKDLMERKIVDRLDEEEIRERVINESRSEMAAIESAVFNLKNSMYRMVLSFRYIDSETVDPVPWPKVAMRMFGDDSEKCEKRAQRYHKKALEILEKSHQ